MKRIKILGLILLIILLITLVWQNRAPVETRILFMTVSMPAAFLLFLTGALGFLTGMLTCLLLSRKPKKPLPPAKSEPLTPNPPP